MAENTPVTPALLSNGRRSFFVSQRSPNEPTIVSIVPWWSGKSGKTREHFRTFPAARSWLSYQEPANESDFHRTAVVDRMPAHSGHHLDRSYSSRTGRDQNGVANEHHCAKRDRDAHPRDPPLPVGREIASKKVRCGNKRPCAALIGSRGGTPGSYHLRDPGGDRLRRFRRDHVDAPATVRSVPTSLKSFKRPRCGAMGSTEVAYRRSKNCASAIFTARRVPRKRYFDCRYVCGTDAISGYWPQLFPTHLLAN